jgi:hypothetical protein
VAGGAKVVVACLDSSTPLYILQPPITPSYSCAQLQTQAYPPSHAVLAGAAQTPLLHMRSYALPLPTCAALRRSGTLQWLVVPKLWLPFWMASMEHRIS